MKRSLKLLITLTAMLLFSFALVLTAEAKGYSGVSPKPESNAERDLITAEPITVRDDADAVGVSARYTVDRDALAVLEENYRVTFGAVVARASDGYDQFSLTLSLDEAGNITAPTNVAVRTVYSTCGAHQLNGTFLSAELNSFSATLNIGSKTVSRSQDGAVHFAFLLLEHKSGEEAPRFLYVGRKSTSYGTTPSLESIARVTYEKNKEDESAVEDYLAFLKEQVKSDVASLQNTRVFVCGENDASELGEHERAIWIKYLPDKDPYPGDPNSAKRNIRAAYIYYPLEQDPSKMSTDKLLKADALRVFAYIGVPAAASDTPGLVCVHGGGGHAYARYVHEAMMNGYAAIAIDTEGYHNITGGRDTPYSELSDAYSPDTLGHLGKDGFKNAEGSLSNQWLYHAVMDTVLANTVLRSFDTVKEDAVGITGISWGGLVTTTALCYDHRYAFAAPVYISFHMTESYGTSLGGIKEEGFASRLWQDASLLSACPVPTMIISSESDMFASVDTISKTAKDLQNAFITVKPDLDHGQQYGASLAEIYHFGHTVLGTSDGFVTPTETPTAEAGNSYTLSLRLPEGAEDVRAVLYYRQEPLVPYTAHKQIVFDMEELTVESDGRVEVSLPEDTVLYFISFSYFSQEAYDRKAGTPYIDSDHYERGYLYSSTDLVFLEQNDD